MHKKNCTIIVFLDIIHCCSYLKHTLFQRLDSVSIFRWNLLSWAQLTELVPIPTEQVPLEDGD
jgi:hypothetical protein